MNRTRIITAGAGYPFAVAVVAAATLAFVPFRGVLLPPTIMLLYVPFIVWVARATGVWQSAAASILAFTALDLLFVPPYLQLRVSSLPEWIGLVVFLLVALVAGQQTGQLRQRERAAIRRQQELELLNRLSFRVAAEKSAESTASFIVGQVAEVLGSGRVALYVGPRASGETGRCLASAGRTMQSSGEEALVAWVLRTGKGISAGDALESSGETGTEWVSPGDAIPGVIAEGLLVPLVASDSLEGVLFVESPVGVEARRWTTVGGSPLAAVANLAASALERARLEVDAANTAVLRETDKLKSTLVSSVSHELKTPLAAATARITGLIEEGAECDLDRMRGELLAVESDLDRLNDSIGDLLDLSRLESDSWRPSFEEHEFGDILGTVSSRLQADQRERVHFDIAAGLDLVSVDFAQMARAMTNLIENALAYSGGEPVEVVVSRARDGVEIRVCDRGPGISDAEKPRVFDKFFRGAASKSAPTGTGLGLAITREIIDSHGGSIHVEDVAPHGACFVVDLPSASEDR